MGSGAFGLMFFGLVVAGLSIAGIVALAKRVPRKSGGVAFLYVVGILVLSAVGLAGLASAGCAASIK